MPARFKIFTNDGQTADRYTVVDTRGEEINGARYHFGVGFNSDPYSPQGIGMHFELNSRDFHAWRARRFNGDRRIRDCREMSLEARRCARNFLVDCGASEGQIADLMLHEDAPPLAGPFAVRYRNVGGGGCDWFGGWHLDGHASPRFPTLKAARRAAADCNAVWYGEVLDLRRAASCGCDGPEGEHDLYCDRVKVTRVKSRERREVPSC